MTGGYQLTPGSTLPPLVFDDEEATALALGLCSVAVGLHQATAEASVRALAKLSSMLPASVRAQIELVSSVTESNPWAGPVAAPVAAVLGTIAQACRDNVRARFDYESIGRVTSHRYVEPYRLVTLGRRWYLVAYDIDRGDWRTFRVDRITSPIPSRNSFSPRPLPANDVAHYVAERIRELRQTIEVEILFEAPIENVVEAIGPGTNITEVSGEGTRVRMLTESFEWPLVAIARVDAEFTAISPPEFLSYLQTLAARAARSSEITAVYKSGGSSTEPIT